MSRARERKVGIYIRVSTEKQVKVSEGSLTSQKQRLEAEVQRRNSHAESGRWGQIVDYYIEEGRSGKDTNRPEYQRLMQDLKAGVIDTIMVTELSRLSRSVSDFLKFMEVVNQHGDFICPQYDFDTTSPAGRVFIIIMMALAQFERELTGERTRNNFYSRAMRGLSNGGHPLLGYDADPTNRARRLINEGEAIAVRRIFQTFLECGSLRKTRQLVNEAGHRTKRYARSTGELTGGDARALRH